MSSVQLGSALSVHLISVVGAAGVAWLRLSLGAVILLALARPRLRGIARRDLPGLIGLGVVTGLQTVAFLSAIQRLPLGTTVAIEFLGPLTVAAVRSHSHSHRHSALLWPALALAGVVLLTSPWHGHVNPAGLVFAVLAAVGWGAYILLTQLVGDRFSGIQGLSLAIPISAVTAAIFGVPQAAAHLGWGLRPVAAGLAHVLPEAAGLALLLPVLPYAFEMLALRRMTSAAFGTLMALEPAISVVLGLVVLHQQPSAVQIIGILLVVLAGAAAQRGGRRPPPGSGPDEEPAELSLAGLAPAESQPAGPDAGGVAVDAGGRVAGLAAVDLAQQFLGGGEDLGDGPAERLGVARGGDVGRDAGLLEDAGEVGQPERQPLERVAGQVAVVGPVARLPAGEGRVVVHPVEAAGLTLDRLQQVDPPDRLADRDRGGRVDRALERLAFQHPQLQPDPVLGALPLPVGRVRVDEVQVAQQNSDPVKAKAVEHDRPFRTKRSQRFQFFPHYRSRG